MKEGDLEAARTIDVELAPAYDLLKVVTNPIAIKCALNLLGHDVGGHRLPLVEATEEEREAVRSASSASGCSSLPASGHRGVRRRRDERRPGRPLSRMPSRASRGPLVRFWDGDPTTPAAPELGADPLRLPLRLRLRDAERCSGGADPGRSRRVRRHVRALRARACSTTPELTRLLEAGADPDDGERLPLVQAECASPAARARRNDRRHRGAPRTRLRAPRARPAPARCRSRSERVRERRHAVRRGRGPHGPLLAQYGADLDRPDDDGLTLTVPVRRTTSTSPLAERPRHLAATAEGLAASTTTAERSRSSLRCSGRPTRWSTSWGRFHGRARVAGRHAAPSRGVGRDPSAWSDSDRGAPGRARAQSSTRRSRAVLGSGSRASRRDYVAWPSASSRRRRDRAEVRRGRRGPLPTGRGPKSTDRP